MDTINEMVVYTNRWLSRSEVVIGTYLGFLCIVSTNPDSEHVKFELEFGFEFITTVT